MTILAYVLIKGDAILGSEENRIKTIYAKCKQETQIDENEMNSFKNMELPSSSKGKCMMGCLMREASILVNGKFNKDGATKVAERYYASRQDDMEKARQVIDTCEKQVENETEECEIASKIATCVIEQAQTVGLNSVPQG
uniref:Odorant binding protein 1 n=1 Tax=Drosicha corpulenta TaxID=535978 RepID=A0A0U3TWR6_9HEMI|nr:odorant binding protein 1 [Drosicha corpulenta]